MPHHLLVDLIAALRLPTGRPPFRRPPLELRPECDAEGLSEQDFLDLSTAICGSRHSLLAARSIRLLVPRRKLSSRDLQRMLAAYSQTNSSLVRLNWCRYWCALWDSDGLTADGKDCIHAGYGVIFHFLQNEKSQKETCRLLYRITRQVDVTSFRCRELSKILQKSPSGGAMALAELFDSFKEGTIDFPAREYGLPGSSGLTRATKVKLHEKVSRVMDSEWTKTLRRHCIMDDEEEEQEQQVFLGERRHSVKRLRILQILQGSGDEPNGALLSDLFHVSKVGMVVEGDPQENLPRDLQSALFAHLLTWDGFLSQDETFQVFSRLSLPTKDEQPAFEKSAVFPILSLFSTCSAVFKFRAARAFGRMLSYWIIREEQCGPFVNRLVSLVDDALCTALAFEKDHPLVQLACVEFFAVTGRALMSRSRVFGSSMSPAVPPSEHLALRLLLSPSVVGIGAMSECLDGLFPVYRLENTAGVHTSSSNKLQSARYFQTLAQDYVKALVLRTGFAPFEDVLKVGERSLLGDLQDSEGDELGVMKSFAFAGLWARWWEERDEIPDKEPSDEKLAAFLTWLKRLVPGVPSLVVTVSTKFNKLMSVE